VAFGEGRPHRDRAGRLEPVPRRPEMAFHAPAGRRGGLPDRVARPRRRAHRHPGTRVGTLAGNAGRPRGPARGHRAQAPVMGREPDPRGFPRTRTRPARPHGRAGTLLADLGHPARRRDIRLLRRGRRRRMRQDTPGHRDREDRPANT
jgi:hypothetical protein